MDSTIGQLRWLDVNKTQVWGVDNNGSIFFKYTNNPRGPWTKVSNMLTDIYNIYDTTQSIAVNDTKAFVVYGGKIYFCFFPYPTGRFYEYTNNLKPSNVKSIAVNNNYILYYLGIKENDTYPLYIGDLKNPYNPVYRFAGTQNSSEPLSPNDDILYFSIGDSSGTDFDRTTQQYTTVNNPIAFREKDSNIFNYTNTGPTIKMNTIGSIDFFFDIEKKANYPSVKYNFNNYLKTDDIVFKQLSIE